MRLTRKKSIELCIELWTWCAKTGKAKWEWPEWKKYRAIRNSCWFCEYTSDKKGRCQTCPLRTGLGFRCINKECYYDKWTEFHTPRTRKKYAKLFLAQIKSLVKGKK